MRPDVVKRVMRALSTFAEIHNKEVAPLLSEHDRSLREVQEDVRALYELVEMNFYVLSRALMEGVFELEDRKESVQRINALQDEYLAAVSVVAFFTHLQNAIADDS